MNNKKVMCEIIYERLFLEYGVVECPLNHNSPFQLMVATMLSAQCTDIRVNRITPALFEVFFDVESMSKADILMVEDFIRTAGLFRMKAKNIVNTSKIICSEYNGEVPGTIEELVKLPGIGRKTANVIVAHAFSESGFPVDTHVIRLLNRIGVVTTKAPIKIEFTIRSYLKETILSNFSLLLITHGRSVCVARSPNCDSCVICDLCKYGKSVVSG